MPHPIVRAAAPDGLPWRRRNVVLALIAGALVAALAAAPLATAAPTAPAPLTVLSPHGAVGRGDIFLTPAGDSSTYANGSEIVDAPVASCGFTRAGRRHRRRLPGADLPRTPRADVLGGQRAGRPVGWDRLHPQRPLPPDRDRPRRQRADHRWPRVPDHAAEHRAGALLRPRHRRSDVARRLRQPVGHRRRGPGGRQRQRRVLFTWNSADHVPYGQSEQPLPASASTPWDWFHINAVHLDTDGNLLADARSTWTAYKVDRHSGRIIWQLGGKASSFTVQAAPGQTLNDAGGIFAWQHDPEALGGGRYTFFDNEAAGRFNLGVDVSAGLGLSRFVSVQLDPRRRTATLVRSDNQPQGLIASSQGNAQTLPEGDVFVGWGSLNYISEFDRFGRLVFNAEFPAGVNSYRAYLLPWDDGHGWADWPRTHGPRRGVG